MDDFTMCPSSDGGDNESSFGPYMTLQRYFDGVESMVYGPDEDCRWVYIDPFSNLVEQSIKHPREPRPFQTIAVAYYAA